MFHKVPFYYKTGFLLPWLAWGYAVQVFSDLIFTVAFSGQTHLSCCCWDFLWTIIHPTSITWTLVLRFIAGEANNWYYFINAETSSNSCEEPFHLLTGSMTSLKAAEPQEAPLGFPFSYCTNAEIINLQGCPNPVLAIARVDSVSI